MFAQTNISGEFKKFLKEHGAKFERERDSDHFLVTGMPRASGKTYTVLKGLLKILPTGRKLLYVARTIGDKEEESGTYYHTEETIREIEKEENLQEHYILMFAGKEKICKEIEEEMKLRENTEREMVILEQCNNCEKKKRLSDLSGNDKDVLRNILRGFRTLTPEKCKDLGEKVWGRKGICPKVIMNFYKEEFADIVFITYARLRYENEKVMEDDYYFVVFDEARYLVDVNTVYDSELITIKTEYKPSEEEFWKECWEKLDEMVFPSTDYIVEKGIGWCYWFKRVLSEKMMAKEWFENLNEIDKSYYAYADTDYYLEYRKLLYNEELQKWQFEYWGFQGDPNFPEYPDEYIHQLDREIIRKKLYEVVRNLDRNNAEMLKSAKCLSILYQIAGSYSVEIEIMDKNPFSQKEGEYGIYLKAYRQQQIPRGEINVYIDATPYPDEFINYWLRVQPEELNIVTIPSSVRVIIAYTNNKKTISGLKSWRNLIPHAGILLFLKESVERMGKTLLLVARNTRIAKMLGRKGVTNILRTYYPQLDVHPIKPKIICGGRGSEGVQEDVDIVILEGPQIKKPESGISKKFEIGRALNQFDSMKAHYLLHQIENCQNMVQAMCRGIDREEKRSNVIVLLGNKMPYEKKSFELPWGI